MIFFISDTHFGHERIRLACKRPFSNTDEMDEALIKNWNKVVKPKDTVYHLGDFAFGNIFKYRVRLNGKLHLILGNHDRLKREDYSLFDSVSDYLKIKHYGQKIILCHYPIHYWDCCHYGSWHLFGHVHGVHTNPGKSKDITVDRINFTPISFDELKPIMEGLEQHVDYSKDRWPK